MYNNMAMNSTLMSVFGILILLFSPAVAVITIENNGYRGLVVAIHNNVTENPKLLESIKNMLVKGSSYLHHVTRERAFIEEVTVVVPSYWSTNKEYEVLQSGDLFQEADLRIDHPNPAYGNEPYTLQPGECGEPGRYIHLTPDFLVPDDDDDVLPTNTSPSGAVEYNPNLNERSPSMFSPYGDLAPVFVHEFAHLRYGVFDEHGVQQDPQTPLFYLDDFGKIRPTGCPKGIVGVLGDIDGNPCRRRDDGLPNDKCTFFPNMNTQYDVDDADDVTLAPTKFSIMYIPGVELADGFCDDESEDRLHNPIAPNKHNLMCQSRSTWDVVTSHPDFALNKNLPRRVNNTTPRIRYVQPKDHEHQTVILVLDLSSSMQGRRMQLLHAACTRFLRFQLPSNTSTVGMVGFSSATRVLAEMTVVTDATRKQLIDKVPKRDDRGYTAIGSGILEGLRVLRQGGRPTEGARLILLSDGEENRRPNVAETYDEVKKSGVIVTTIALGKTASSKLEELVRITGGNGYFYDDKTTSLSGLDSSFTAAVTVNAPVELQPVEIGNRNASVASSQEYVSHFHIDKELGKDTVFRVSYDAVATGSNLQLTLTSPGGETYNSKSPEFLVDDMTRTMSFKIPQAMPGKWRYSIKNKGSINVGVATVISSEATNQEEQPIRVRSWVSDVEFTHPARVKVYAEVKKGYAAILGALVTSVIYRPDGNPLAMVLEDNGIGADSTANDGIYSGYFTKFDGSGRYSVEANVVNNGKARLYLGKEQSGSAAPVVPVLTPEKAKKLGAPKASFAPDELVKEEEEEQQQQLGIPDNETGAVEAFERYSMAGSFRLNKWQKNVDLIAPSRVTDLRVVETNLSTRIVQLQWTASGDDLQDDRANDTQMRYHLDPIYLQKYYNSSMVVEEHMLVNSSLQPPEPRTPHHVAVQLPSEEHLFLNESNYRVFFVVRTSDEAGNTADMSNLAVAQFVVPAEKEPLVEAEKPPSSAGLLVVLVAAGAVLLLAAVGSVLAWKARARWLDRRRDRLNVAASMGSLQAGQSNEYICE